MANTLPLFGFDLLQLHGLTISLITVLVVTLMMTVTVAVWRFNRGIPGLGEWALASVGGFAVLLVHLMRSRLPEVLAVVLTNLLLLSVAYLIWAAGAAYVGKRLPRRDWPWWLIAALVIAAIYFTVWQPDLRMRIVLQGAGIALFYGLAARALATGGVARYPARYLFSLALVVHGLFTATLRPWLLSQSADLNPSTNILPALVGLESMIFFILLSLGIVLLVIEHIAHQLRMQAENDGLTNVFNRRAFFALLEKACSQSNRSGTPLAVLLIDLDHFKQVNDTWGHRCGDDVLRSFVHCTSSMIRSEDVMGRLGGEEFSVFLPDTTLAQARVIAERIRQACADDQVASSGQLIRYTVSVGVARYQVNELPEAVMHRADQVMYQAKSHGRNQVQIQAEF